MPMRVVFTCILLFITSVSLHADQTRSDLGVTRSELVSLYSKPAIGVKFKQPDRLTDGRTRVMGQTASGNLLIEIIGPAYGSIETASVIFANDSTRNRLLGSAATLALVNRIFPKWEGFTDWIGEAMSANGKKSYRNGIRVECVVVRLDEGTIISFTIDAK